MLISLIGNSTILQEVIPDDAEQMCNLRNNPQINRFLSSTETILVEDQKAWLKKNAEKHDNFYFKILNKKTGEFCGTIALYDIEHNMAEFGRYICTSPLQSIEAEYLIIKFGFDVVFLDKIYCRTVKANQYVWNQHYKYGFKDIREEVLGPRQMLHMIQEQDVNSFRNYDFSFIDKLSKRIQ
jgi:RimJ/RimL family protein N-acetyltransferase